jgi:hypothetical protein
VTDDRPRYVTVHLRLARLRGPASARSCESCGQPAQQWAYDHQDPAELVEYRNGRLMPYSTDVEHYRPLCTTCHVAADRVESGWSTCGAPGCSRAAVLDFCADHPVTVRPKRGLALGHSFGEPDVHGRKRPAPAAVEVEGPPRECRACHEVKPLAAFALSKRHRDGHVSICLPCDRARLAAYYRRQHGLSA